MRNIQASSQILQSIGTVSERAWLAQEIILLRYLSTGGDSNKALATRMRRTENSINIQLSK